MRYIFSGNRQTAWLNAVVTFVAFALSASVGLHGQDSDTPSATAGSTQPTSQSYPERALREEWYTFKPSGAEASFEMPAKPRPIERLFTPVDFEPPIKVHLQIASVAKGSATFIFGWHDLHTSPRNRIHRKEILDGAVRGSVANVMGTLNREENALLQGNEGRTYNYLFTREAVIYKVSAEVYLVGDRQYQFSTIMKQAVFDDHAATHFTSSVKLLDPDGDLPPRPRKKTDG